jgi:hypothetical protein
MWLVTYSKYASSKVNYYGLSQVNGKSQVNTKEEGMLAFLC